ncbi:hypothetical protein AALA44_03075 [Enterococcus ratti]|uniref:hypothetical protein n=1 Tax=Enterococcus ratti TaxID=150033 RepID=UPI003513384B
MKNYWKNSTLFFFLFPYVYFSLLLDFHYHSVFGLIFLIFFAFHAGFFLQKKKQLSLLFLGNIGTTAASFFAYHYFSDWYFFYQPFKPTELILLLSFLYLIPQFLGIFWARLLTPREIEIRHTKNNQNGNK